MRVFGPAVDPYLAGVVRACAGPDSGVVSVVLFGSAATGSYSPEISDVDLLIVLADGATPQDKQRVCDTVAEIEARCGVAKRYAYRRGTLDAIADRITANVRSFFVCTRAGLLSGEPARILGIPPIQARFVDRAAIPSIIASGVTIWGEDLLHEVPFAPIRRVDVAKAFFSSFSQAYLALATYPILEGATKYSMEALKRSIHNCYYCYHFHAAPLSEEAAFFERRIRRNATLAELMELRTAYRRSFGFVLRCLPMLVRLHFVTARDNTFPRDPRATRQ